MAKENIPLDRHITYQQQYRKCGKPSCKACREGKGHGPYWYAYWRQGGKLRSTYVGKMLPDGVQPITASNRHNAALSATACSHTERQNK